MDQFKGENRDELVGGEYLDDGDSENVIEMERADNNIPAKMPDLKNQVISYSVTMAQIAKLAKEYKEVPADLTVKANYALVKKATSQLRGLRGEVEARRKELKSDALVYGRKVDAAAKEITEKLVEIEEPFATAKKEFDTRIELEKREKALAEERRVDGINARIAAISVLVQAHISSSSDVIKQEIDKLSFMSDTDWADEFREKASLVLSETHLKLGELYTMKLNAETAEADRLAAEAKRKEEEESARVARDAELEKQRLELEAERDRLAAENKRIADEAAVQAEQARQEQAIKAAEAKKIQDEKDWQHYEELRIAQEQQEEDRKRRKAEQDEKDRIQAKKDAEAAAELQAMRDKLAAAEEEKKPAILYSPSADTIAQNIHQEENKPDLQQTVDKYAEQYREAGNAMLAIICNKPVTKALLDAIIAGKVKNIYFQGEKLS